MMSILRTIFKKKPNLKNNNRFYNVDDFEDAFAVQNKLLGRVGIWIIHNFSGFATKSWNVYFWLEVANIIMAETLIFLKVVVTFAEARSFQDGLNGFGMIPCVGFCTLFLLKAVKIRSNVNIFRNMYQELRAMWPRGEVPEEDHRIIRAELKQLKVLVTAYHWCNIALIIGFAFPSYYNMVRRYLGYDADMILPYAYWMPFDIYKHFIIDFMLFLQTWHGNIVVWTNEAVDLLFCTFLGHITMQFDLLAMRVRRLVHVPVDQQLADSYPLGKINREYVQVEEKESLNYTDNDWKIKQRQELNDIIQRHHTLIRLSNDVESVFSFTLLINFMNSSLLICFCGFFSVCIEKWNEGGYKSFLVTALSQTWVVCWYGQKLLDSSLNFSEALYECGWYNASKRIKSSILVMFIRAQRGVNVTTYGFTTISLESYSTIIKTSWSYFTLLLNFFKSVEDGTDT